MNQSVNSKKQNAFTLLFHALTRIIYATAKDGYDAYCLLRSWCSMAEATQIPEVKAMAKTIRNHMKGILGYWKLGGATNASMEGFNGKVRWLINQAFGFRDFKYFD